MLDQPIYKELSYQIVGCAMEVHKVLGPGFLEKVYEEAFKVELELNNIKYASQAVFPVNYKNRHVKDYICDLIIDDKVIIELKSIKAIGDLDRAQILNYLKVTNYKLGLIINFGSTSLEYERMVY
ncbi:MAG: GxxExxY protein [Candidatus Marinimicrobia bacterium]|nr:GxxExxY protein [Candidatus Neomarinimicrobiota bacterium]